MRLEVIKYNDGYLGISSKEQVELGTWYYECDNNIPVYQFTESTFPGEYYLPRIVCTTPNLGLDGVPFFELPVPLRNGATAAARLIENILLEHGYHKESSAMVYLKFLKDDLEELYTTNNLKKAITLARAVRWTEDEIIEEINKPKEVKFIELFVDTIRTKSYGDIEYIKTNIVDGKEYVMIKDVQYDDN